MARAFVCLALALLAVGAVGCGGALAHDPDGGGGTGGTAGTTGVGGTGVDGSSYEGVYTWGDVRVQVGLYGERPSWLSLAVSDPATPADVTSMQFPAAAVLNPSDGAYVRALYGCTNTALQIVDVFGCADSSSATRAPGCLAAHFNEFGVTGDFVLPDGNTCSIVNPGDTASLLLPPPGAPQSPAGTGTFKLNCLSAAGLHRQLDGNFGLLTQSTFLLCAAGD